MHIGWLNVDEAHHIVTAGQPRGKSPAFRPAYNNIHQIFPFLPPSTPRCVYSATLPPKVLAEVKSNLRLTEGKTVEMLLSTNRPNLLHALIPMIGSFKNYANLDFLVPLNTDRWQIPMRRQEKTIVFVDNRLATSAIAKRLNSRYAPEKRRTRPVRHLHSKMSKEYIQATYNEFKKSDSQIDILIATASVSNVRAFI